MPRAREVSESRGAKTVVNASNDGIVWKPDQANSMEDRDANAVHRAIEYWSPIRKVTDQERDVGFAVAGD